MRLARWAAMSIVAALATVSLSACETGSKSAPNEYYSIDLHWSQAPNGGVILTGDTDLPDGSQIDALITRADKPEEAVDRAVLIGSTAEQPLSKPVKNGGFTIDVVRVLVNSCGLQPPCGPFPAGTYHLLVDARTPAGPIGGNGLTVFDDPRYLSTTHGVGGFTGLEIFREVTLQPIQTCLDGKGEQRDGGCES